MGCHFLLQGIFTTEAQGKLLLSLCVLVAQSCPTLCNPMDWGPPGSSVHGIFQARKLEWVAILFFQGIFPTQGIELGSPTLQADSLPSEPPGKTTITSTKWTISPNLKNKTSYLNYLLLHSSFLSSHSYCPSFLLF